MIVLCICEKVPLLRKEKLNYHSEVSKTKVQIKESLPSCFYGHVTTKNYYFLLVQ